jgi:hypothetical protein
MTSPSEKVQHLRQLLAERFQPSTPCSEKSYQTGFAPLDQVGIPQGALTEIVTSPSSGPGGSLLLYGLLHALAQKGERVVLIDGKDSFAPKGLPQESLNQLLWNRCHHASEAVKAADLIIRDGNLPLTLVLLNLNPPGELRRIPATVWHRLQMLAEKSSTTVMIFSPHAQVGCARLRLSVGGAFPLTKLHRCRTELLSSFTLEVERRRFAREERLENENLRRPLCA